MLIELALEVAIEGVGSTHDGGRVQESRKRTRPAQVSRGHEHSARARDWSRAESLGLVSAKRSRSVARDKLKRLGVVRPSTVMASTCAEKGVGGAAIGHQKTRKRQRNAGRSLGRTARGVKRLQGLPARTEPCEPPAPMQLPQWLSNLLPILGLLVAIGIVLSRLPKVDMGHSTAFKRRRVFDWLPLGLTYAFLYFGRYNLSTTVDKFEPLLYESPIR